MNTFKKAFASLMALLLLTVFVACKGGNDGEAQSDETPTTTSTQTTDGNAENADSEGITVKPGETTATSDTTDTEKPTETTSADDVKPGHGDGDWGSYNPM